MLLYIVGFVPQIAGGLLVVAEVREDRRTAKRIADGLPVTFENVDSVGTLIKERLSSGSTRRSLGVALIFIGAAVALAANLTAL